MFKDFLLIICACYITACNGQKTNLNVSADYISLYFAKDKNNTIAHWENVRKMPIGAFTCKEQENGDLIIKYNPQDSVTKFVNVSNDKSLKESLDKLPKNLSSLQIKGIYINPTEPFNFYQAVYSSKEIPNAICIVTFTIPGANIIGANFYSGEPVNPLKEENIQL
ncbi:hypothetical protein [[Flexibacter] sp. ATCC 35208]|uniref:hypothetical protein n=1 Tax=[Flexibacter] sp. ATCC 35208 TaxID=1936242 RepID=UPI0009C73DD4|nr:hypothetical protein [[Flexibacter] sp. ATCC 35208]OMP79270.1 hypothetical protein BW716_10455 [[Flexibacter] sp. ATCC 35208]